MFSSKDEHIWKTTLSKYFYLSHPEISDNLDDQNSFKTHFEFEKWLSWSWWCGSDWFRKISGILTCETFILPIGAFYVRWPSIRHQLTTLHPLPATRTTHRKKLSIKLSLKTFLASMLLWKRIKRKLEKKSSITRWKRFEKCIFLIT